MVPADDSASPAAIDRSVLERMRSRFAGSRMFLSAEIVEAEKLHLRIELADGYYPDEGSARCEVRWYRNDDFAVNSQEERLEST